MPTTTKDSMPGSSIESKAGGSNPQRTDAVGVEIPVVVHASRNSVAAREIAKPQPPVHEETRTVIVFPHGAVVRLTAAMTTGELVVLTNQRSGADVLCRVSSVKAQPGIQNYVDLEFTQRAPGFWGDCFPSEQSHAFPAVELAAPPASSSFTPSFNKPAPPTPPAAPVTFAAPSVPAAPPTSVSLAPTTPPMPAPVVAAPIASAISAAPTATPAVTFSLPSMRPEPEPPAFVQAAPAVSGGSVGMGLTRPPDQQQPWTRSYEPSPRSEEAAPGSRKMILLAVAAVVVLSAIGGGIVMLRRGPATAVVSQAAEATQSVPAALPAAAMQPPSAVGLQPAAVVAPPKQEVVASPATRTNAPSSPRSPEPIVTQSVEESPKSVPLPKQPSREAVARAVGRLSAPVAKKSAAASSGEAPPVLPASASAGPASASLLMSSENSGPVSPTVLARNTTLAGGRVLEPKLISSTPPIYPKPAAVQRAQGDVVVDALVDSKGRVTDAKVVSGPALLQQAAINAVRTWKYEPARLDGEPVSAHLQVRISFHLP